MTIVDHLEHGVASFLAGYAPPLAAGSAGEALLAVALAARDAESRGAAKALLREAAAPRLAAALAGLPRRNYREHVDTLVADLEWLDQLEGFDVPTFAFAVCELAHGADRVARRFWCGHAPAAYVRAVARRELAKSGAARTLQLPAFGAEVLYPVLAEFTEVRHLAFEVIDRCDMLDLTPFTELEGVTVTGPVTTLTARHLGDRPLTYVHLRDTAIDDLAALADQPRLERLAVRGGPLRALPEAAWPALTELDLRDCPELVGLPASLARWSRLERLTLARCPRVATLPEELVACAELRALDVSSCGVTTLPASLPRVPLTSLHLYGLDLQRLPAWPGATPPATVSVTATLPLDATPDALAYLGQPSTARLARDLLGYLDLEGLRPTRAVGRAFAGFVIGARPAKIHVSELRLALEAAGA
ncbi:MAG: hypothetical protein R2939_07275 [Kofleriaceae bacterium]